LGFFVPLSNSLSLALSFFFFFFCGHTNFLFFNSSVDFRGKLWVCPICFQRNPFPPAYADISEQNLPAELLPQYSTIDYMVSRNIPPVPPVFVFIVDVCLPEEELQAVKDSIIMATNLLPEGSLIGLITFGTTVWTQIVSFLFLFSVFLRAQIFISFLPFSSTK
jgi:hypothetical protein